MHRTQTCNWGNHLKSVWKSPILTHNESDCHMNCTIAECSYCTYVIFLLEFKLEFMRGIAILVTCDYRGKHGLELPATNTDADEMRKMQSRRETNAELEYASTIQWLSQPRVFVRCDSRSKRGFQWKPWTPPTSATANLLHVGGLYMYGTLCGVL